jgi:alkanesulfonate monooxygenase SsuD/methylene tetrahydromethanopterin reductase-like flavin-dependent oxidoreductase (luciferase family)
MELGIYTFGDIVADPHTGRKPTAGERMQQMLDMALLADEGGLDVIGVGEHHGLGFVNSATATTIAGMAARTKRIRLTSASTLLSTADPVRTFQEFATADLVSGGRVEIIFGRGAFNDNFPLFGFDMKDYDALFAEKLQLFELLNSNERVTWSGRFRPPLDNSEIAPRPHQPKLPVSIGALSQGSVSRAARLGLSSGHSRPGRHNRRLCQARRLLPGCLGAERTPTGGCEDRLVFPPPCHRDCTRDPAGFLPVLLGLYATNVRRTNSAGDIRGHAFTPRNTGRRIGAAGGG